MCIALPGPRLVLGKAPLRLLFSTLFLAAATGCMGSSSLATSSESSAGEPGGDSNVSAPGGNPTVAGPYALGRGASGIQRLSRVEYTRTMQLLLGIDLTADIETTIPPDNKTPFDNDYTRQDASKPLVEGYQAIAERAAALVVADATRRAAVVGCTPKSEADAACFRQFITQFGRRAFRRPLSTEEVDAYAGLLGAAAAKQTFAGAVGLALRAFLQSPDFLYRIEVGVPGSLSNGAVELTHFEWVTRFSYLLRGEPPDDALLDLAASGELADPGRRRAMVESMVDDPRGQAQVQRFHALLWQYDAMQISGAIVADLRKETDALIKRVVFENRASWLDLFRSKETYVNAALRDVYGMAPKPGAGFEWVPYPRPDQGGILAHGSLLSNGASGTDTSPTFRGKFVRERMLCQHIPPPPPDADTNLPTDNTAACKKERFKAHQDSPSCAGCHSLMDPIGFGLENYDPTGRYRATEPGKADCAISGEGELAGVGKFQGSAGLSQLIVQQPDQVQRCMLEGLYGYTLGRAVLRADDEKLVDALSQRFAIDNHDLRKLMVTWLTTDSFRYRVIDELSGDH